jgi:PAS domain S-box-containing protein
MSDRAAPRDASWAVSEVAAAVAETVFDRMPMGVALFDTDLRLQRCNPTFAAYVGRYGVVPAEAVVPGTSFFSYFPGVDAIAASTFARVRAGEVRRFEAFPLEVNGEVSYWDIVFTPLWRDGRVVGIIDVTTDITEQRRAEEQLRRRDSILSAVRLAAERFLTVDTSWEAAIDEVLAHLGEAAGASRVYLFENTRTFDDVHTSAPSVVARKREEWLATGLSPPAGVHAPGAVDYDARGWRRWAEVLASGQVLHARTRDLPPGERPDLEAAGIRSLALVPIFVENEWWGFLGFDECVTERDWPPSELDALQAAASTIGAALQRGWAEEKYRRIFEATTDGLVLSDANGNIVEANPAFCRNHGYRLGEVAGRPATDFVHSDDHHVLRSYRDAVNGGHDFQSRARNVRQDGTEVPVEIHGTSFTYRGRPHTLAVVRDVTERASAFALLEQRIAALARVAGSLTLDQTLTATLETLAAAVVDAGPAVACSFQLVDPATGDLSIVACHGQPDGYIEALQSSWRSGVSSPTRRALERQELIMVPEARRLGYDNPQYAALHPLLDQVEWNSIVVVPFDALGRSVGAMNVYYRSVDEVGVDEQTFLGAVAHQSAVVVENVRLLAEAQAKASLEERQRLARELHDSVSQALYGIALGARTARTLAERDPGALIEPLDYVLGLAQAALAEMRSLNFELRPETLATEGLVAALDRQVTALQARHEVAVDAELGTEPDLPLESKEALYRIAQEALHNVVKHARAGRIRLVLGRDGEATVLEIVDDGIGFDAGASYPGHLGLTTMVERAVDIGGAATVSSEPGAGTVVRVSVPAR